MYQGARRPGKVLTVNDKRGIFKMRFDEFPTAEFDYSFSYKSPAWSYINPTSTPTPSASFSSSLSSSSSSTATATTTTAETTNTDNEPLFTISRKFKALIKVKTFLEIIEMNYFLF